jgi:hypothetical protein
MLESSGRLNGPIAAVTEVPLELSSCAIELHEKKFDENCD